MGAVLPAAFPAYMTSRRIDMTVRRLFVALSILGSLSSPARAQVSTATLSGVVTDPSKSVLPGVSVTATALANGRQYVAVSDGQGNYGLLNLAPGKYRVQAELSGFATVAISELERLVGQIGVVPIVLTLAALRET